MSTFNRLDLQTLGSQPAMPKNLPDQWWGPCSLAPTKISLFQKTPIT